MRRAAIITLVFAAGCLKNARESAKQTGLRTSASADDDTLQPWCWDSVEVRALACSNGTARRSGDTFYIRLANAREVAFAKDLVSEARGGYKYVGRVPRSALQVVRQNGHETSPTWDFIDE